MLPYQRASNAVRDALNRAEQRLFHAPVLESFIARREAGDASADRETAAALAAELVSHQGANGSWGDSLALTAESLLLLADLRPFDADVDAAITRIFAWLRSRQRAPGRFAEDCTPDRHAAGLCAHYATGFFSPGPREHSFAGTTLSTGARFPTDEDARLALSALALRAVLVWRCDCPADTACVCGRRTLRMDDVLQIDALRRVADLLFRNHTAWSVPAGVSVIATLTQAQRTPEHLAIVHAALSRLARLQRADGTWPGAEMFHVADALLLAVASGYGSPVFDSALSRMAEVLVVTQQPDGSWGNDAGPYRLLTGWRTLRHAIGGS